MDRRHFLSVGSVGAALYGIGPARVGAQDEEQDEPEYSFSYLGAKFKARGAKSPNSWPVRFATHESISHSRNRKGHPANMREDWWQDPCKDNEGFSCYGPYEPMEAGEWLARWAFRVEFRKPRFHERPLPLVGMDVVTNGGKRRLAGPVRVTWGDAYGHRNEEFGRMGYSDTLELRFVLPNKLDRVEVRIRSFELADCFFAKLMSAEYVT